MISAVLIAVAIAGWLWTIYAFGAIPWAAVAWAAVAFLAVVLTARTALRIVAFNAALLIALSGLFTPSFDQRDRDCQDIRGSLWMNDPDVVYRNIPNNEVRDARVCGDGTIYDSTYHTDAHGLRVSPPASGDDDECVLFFGCSFTFGIGVEDEETMPYRVGVATRGRYQVRNFGVGGHGAHHVLATVQGSDWLEALRCKPKVAIYQAIPTHANRAVESWHVESGMQGPRYVLGADGVPRREGNLEDVRRRNVLTRMIAGWPPTRRFMEERDREIDDATAELFMALIDEWARTLRRHFPEIDLHVIYWAHFDNRELPWASLKGITVHRIAEMLPKTDDWGAAYHIPGDGHPNVTAHQLIADYVVEEILRLP